MKTLAAALWLVIAGASVPACAQQLPPTGGPYPPSFTATLSNNTPLAFGMDAEEASQRARHAAELHQRPSRQ